MLHDYDEEDFISEIKAHQRMLDDEMKCVEPHYDTLRMIMRDLEFVRGVIEERGFKQPAYHEMETLPR